jgi:DNA-binding transcriptional LysR family regulator
LLELTFSGALSLSSSQLITHGVDMIAHTPWFIRARLRTRHLQLLTAIGEEGNIQRAAELLNMSQSAASRLLSDVEEIIGTPLFDRLARGVRANWYGQSMVRHARIALASLSEAAREIELLKSGRAGQVTIGAISGPAISFVPRAVASMARDYPLVRLQMQVESNDRLLDELQQGTIDVMVGRLPERHDTSNYHYQRLADEPLCVAVRKGHPLERSSPQTPDLAAASWIVPRVGSVLRHRFDLMFRDAGLAAPTQIIEADSPMVVTRLLEETDCLALVSREVADYYAAYGLVSVLPVTLPCHVESFGLVTRKDVPMAPAACLVCEALEEAAQNSTRPIHPLRRSITAV